MRANTYVAGMLKQTQQKQRCFAKNLRDRKHNNTWIQYLLNDNHESNNKISIIDDYNDLDRKLVYYQINKFIVCLLNNSIFTNEFKSDDKLKTFDHADDLAKANLLSSESILSTKERNLLFHKKTLNIEETESKNNFCNNSNYKTNDRYRGTGNQNLYFQDKIDSKLVKQARQQLFSLPYLLVLILLLISNQNAQLCNGFSDPLRNDNIGVIGNHFSHQLSTITPNLNFPSYRNMIRSFNNDPLVIMPSSPDSFTNDESGQPHLSDWRSKLSGAFSGAPQKNSLDMHIENILVPRVSGTQDNVKVRQYIVDSLRANNYHIELDEFTDSTPIGKVQFANIIASSNPNACRQLVLACHYDSKMMDGFLGATDSAVPCAMLLKISETFSKQFRDSSQSFKETLGLRLIFFDGEEAFDEWGPKDSLYGSRHLAEKWERQPSPPQCNGKNELSRIELFVLLDLIGAEDTSFVMYSIPLKHHYNAMQRYEKAYLAKAGLTSLQMRRDTMFKGRFVPLDFVEDDHVPFKKRGVPILSLLAHPFPKVWHTVEDNYKAIDFPKTRRVLHVLEEFVANYKKEAN